MIVVIANGSKAPWCTDCLEALRCEKIGAEQRRGDTVYQGDVYRCGGCTDMVLIAPRDGIFDPPAAGAAS